MRKTLSLVLILVLLTGPLGCASGGIKTLPMGSAEAPKDDPAVVARTEGGLTVKAGTSVSTGYDPNLLSVAGFVPIEVVVHNTGKRRLVVRSAETVLDLPDGQRVAVLGAGAVEERFKAARELMDEAARLEEAPPSQEASGGRPSGTEQLVPQEPPPANPTPAAETPPAPRGDERPGATRSETWESVKDVGKYLAVETGKALGEIVVMTVGQLTMPVWLPLFVTWVLIDKANKRGAEAQLKRDDQLARLQDVELASDEAARAILYFPPDGFDPGAVLVVPFTDAETREAALVRLPLGRPE